MYESDVQMYRCTNHRAMANHNAEVPRSKALSGSKFNSAFYSSKVNLVSTRNSWELSG